MAAKKATAEWFIVAATFFFGAKFQMINVFATCSTGVTRQRFAWYQDFPS